MTISCAVLMVVSLVGIVVFYYLGNFFLAGLSVVLVVTFLIGSIFMFSNYFSDYEPGVHSGKNADNDIKQFDGIYESMLTITKESELKETYSRIIDTL